MRENWKMKSKAKDYDRLDYARLAPEAPVDGAFYIDKILEKFGIDINTPEAQLNFRWVDVVGEELAKVISYEKVKDGVLNIACKNPSVATYVRLNSKDIIKKIDSAFPELEVKKIAVRVNPY